MSAIRIILLGAVLLVVGWLLGGLWQQLIIDAFQDTGAQIVVSDPAAGGRDRALYTLLTGSASVLAVGVQALLVQVTGKSRWPLWLLAVLLLLGENLSVMLRMVALATLSLPHAVGVAAATNVAPTLDISEATIAPWALGGLLGAAVIMAGMLTVMGLLAEEDEA